MRIFTDSQINTLCCEAMNYVAVQDRGSYIIVRRIEDGSTGHTFTFSPFINALDMISLMRTFRISLDAPSDKEGEWVAVFNGENMTASDKDVMKAVAKCVAYVQIEKKRQGSSLAQRVQR